MHWLTALNHLRDISEPAVLVTLVSVRGHAPREAGAKMVVSAGACWDTVGGGNLEATATQRARALLKVHASAPELLTLRLTSQAPAEHGRQCCGGEVTLLLEPVLGARPHVAVFGFGHVGLELARILSRLPLHLHLIDSREAQFSPERLAGLQEAEAQLHLHPSPIPEMTLAELPAGTNIVIMTHDHAEDAALCDAALRRPDLGFVGLIGSGAKWSHFREQLNCEGHTDAALARITTPIGVPGISGKAPAVIAISVAAQLLQVISAQTTPTSPSQKATRS
ncbi:xanthine dehydrogenase accessory protein XdhC [Deinococcus cavernae]|uniref:Xanthine dehydrogenase accessory protein XdhC n=1 Tax=Deinococcus cavernae TaxID=2320857 RepID=A0A418VGT6_9DEIO|nr:xanthine dehydrogenase accessory protein XdhC [Deinococcus cavernae]RJF75205.1 xanthine dehydrogenase accessory protein XdhC [Deinococcus cavernae]RJF75328.1 xanthine dehydrogenase accessory protein XdhC [Deinococcus cavernae]